MADKEMQGEDAAMVNNPNHIQVKAAQGIFKYPDIRYCNKNTTGCTFEMWSVCVDKRPTTTRDVSVNLCPCTIYLQNDSFLHEQHTKCSFNARLFPCCMPSDGRLSLTNTVETFRTVQLLPGTVERLDSEKWHSLTDTALPRPKLNMILVELEAISPH